MIKTVSLETAKLLEKNGFPHESSFAYCLHVVTVGSDYVHTVWDGQGINSCGTQYRKVYAPTTDELLEELPNMFEYNHYAAELIIQRGKEWKWSCRYVTTKEYVYSTLDENLCEALAQMWLWLKKEGLNGQS